MDRAPCPSIVTPLSVDPDRPTCLRLPVPRDPGVTLRRDGPVPRHPDVRSCGLLPCVRPRDPNVRRTRLGRHRLYWRRGWWRGCLNGRGPHVTAPQDQERHQKRSENAPTPHVPLQSPLALACGRGLQALHGRGVHPASNRHVVFEQALSKAHARPPTAISSRSWKGKEGCDAIVSSARRSGRFGAC